MQKTIMVAKSRNNVIGLEGNLPWQMPADAQYYHRAVKGHWALIGRKAFEAEPSLPPVAGFYLLTRDVSYQVPDQKVFHNVASAMLQAEIDGVEQLFILGGGHIYDQLLPLADRLMITEIEAEFEGDAFFPEFSDEDWKEVSRKSFPADKENPYPYAFTIWERI